MKKEITVTFDSTFEMSLENGWVTFANGISGNVLSLPIEVFYQMWNSDELINHMEQYHQDRKDK